MPGDKPSLTIDVRRKDAGKGTRSTKILVAWPGKYPGAYNAKIADGVKIKLADGTVLDADSTTKDGEYWINAKNWDVDARKPQRNDEPRKIGTEDGDDIQF